MFGFGRKSKSSSGWFSQPRQKSGRYGKPGTWRKNRGSDSTSRNKNGTFKKK